MHNTDLAQGEADAAKDVRTGFAICGFMIFAALVVTLVTLL